MIKLNERKILELHNELETCNEYVPLILLQYIDNLEYFKCSDEKVHLTVRDHRNRLAQADNPWEYLYYDLEEWLDNHKEYKEQIIV